MNDNNEESPRDRSGAARGSTAMRALCAEPGRGPSPVPAPSVAPRGSEVARRRRRRRSAPETASGSPPPFAAQRFAALAAKLATRVSTWRWVATYERWKRGDAVSTFQRRWLAFSMRRVRGELGPISHAEFIATVPWPVRGGVQ